MKEKKEQSEQKTPEGEALSDPHKGAHDDGAAKKRNTPKKSHDKVNQLEAKVQTLTKDRDELNDKYLRTLAEMDNYRKRVTKEKEEFQKYVLTNFLFNLLQVYDNLERALTAKETGNDKAVISGIEITVKQFMEILKTFQVQEIDALGKPFNPELHEALSKEEHEDVNEPVVTEVYQKGFLYNNRLLRPALVKVRVPTAKMETEPANELPQ